MRDGPENAHADDNTLVQMHIVFL